MNTPKKARQCIESWSRTHPSKQLQQTIFVPDDSLTELQYWYQSVHFVGSDSSIMYLEIGKYLPMTHYYHPNEYIYIYIYSPFVIKVAALIHYPPHDDIYVAVPFVRMISVPISLSHVLLISIMTVVRHNIGGIVVPFNCVLLRKPKYWSRTKFPNVDGIVPFS